MVDEKDLKILNLLRVDAWKPVREIAEELGLPRATVQERIQKMRKEGVIRQFSMKLDYSKLGKPTTAFILVSFLQGAVSQRALAEDIAKIPGIHEVHVISGEYDILLKVRAASVEEIGKLVIDRLRALPGVGKTVTCACFSTIKEEI